MQRGLSFRLPGRLIIQPLCLAVYQRGLEMTNQDKLKMALALLDDINDNWNEDKVVNYPQNLLSFDELIAEMRTIELSY